MSGNLICIVLAVAFCNGAYYKRDKDFSHSHYTPSPPWVNPPPLPRAFPPSPTSPNWHFRLLSFSFIKMTQEKRCLFIVRKFRCCVCQYLHMKVSLFYLFFTFSQFYWKKLIKAQQRTNSFFLLSPHFDSYSEFERKLNAFQLFGTILLSPFNFCCFSVFRTLFQNTHMARKLFNAPKFMLAVEWICT